MFGLIQWAYQLEGQAGQGSFRPNFEIKYLSGLSRLSLSHHAAPVVKETAITTPTQDSHGLPWNTVQEVP